MTENTIIVTGGSGFVGSNVVRKLNQHGLTKIIIIDNYEESKYENIKDLLFIDYINYTKGSQDIESKLSNVEVGAVIHVGANADVLNRDPNVMMDLNFEHSKFYLNFCQKRNIPLIFASSSAVYGNSEKYCVDNKYENPHNTYAWSKWMFDHYVLNNIHLFTSRVVGLRFFNIFGIGEIHKGKNASLPYRFFSFIRDNGVIDLFDKFIERDYVWVEDVADVILDVLLDQSIANGIYNLGSGTTISHKEVAEIVTESFINRGIKSASDNLIEAVPMPDTLIKNFQFYTKAENIPEFVSKRTNNNRVKMQAYVNQLISKTYENI